MPADETGLRRSQRYVGSCEDPLENPEEMTHPARKTSLRSNAYRPNRGETDRILTVVELSKVISDPG